MLAPEIVAVEFMCCPLAAGVVLGDGLVGVGHEDVAEGVEGAYEGLFSPVLAPEIVAVGVAFPLAPGAYSVTELPSLLATNVVPEEDEVQGDRAVARLRPLVPLVSKAEVAIETSPASPPPPLTVRNPPPPPPL